MSTKLNIPHNLWQLYVSMGSYVNMGSYVSMRSYVSIGSLTLSKPTACIR
jgi:hypothetical protein